MKYYDNRGNPYANKVTAKRGSYINNIKKMIEDLTEIKANAIGLLIHNSDHFDMDEMDLLINQIIGEYHNSRAIYYEMKEGD